MNKIIIFYAFVIFLFTLFTYLFVDSNLIYLRPIYSGFALTYPVIVTSIYIIFIFLLFGFYIFFLKIAKSNTLSKKMFKIIMFTSCILVFSYPAILSFDIFNYFSTAKVLYFYHENPYLVMPVEFKGDSMLLFTRAANKYALYGPTWLTLSAIPEFLGARNFFITISLFKVLAGVFYFGIIALIFKLTKNMYSVVFFALNPLVLLEVFVSGHNDSVMMALALFSFYLLYKKKFLISFILIILSVFVKYATIFLLPVYGLYLYKQIVGQKINVNRIWLFAAACMFVIFVLSFVREEIYPWYAVWFLPFVAILNGYRLIKLFAIALTLGLALYYVPYMILGTYAFPTPILKITLSILPVVLLSFYLVISKYGKSN